MYALSEDALTDIRFEEAEIQQDEIHHKKSDASLTIRKNFPETWIWNEIEYVLLLKR